LNLRIEIIFDVETGYSRNVEAVDLTIPHPEIGANETAGVNRGYHAGI